MGNRRKRKKSMKFCCGLNFLTPTFAARGRSDFLAEIVGRVAGTVLPGFFSLIQVFDCEALILLYGLHNKLTFIPNLKYFCSKNH